MSGQSLCDLFRHKTACIPGDRLPLGVSGFRSGFSHGDGDLAILSKTARARVEENWAGEKGAQKQRPEDAGRGQPRQWRG